MEALRPFEMWVTIYRSTRRHTIKHLILHQHNFQNPNSHISVLIIFTQED